MLKPILAALAAAVAFASPAIAQQKIKIGFITTMSGPQGEIPMEGEFADGKLTMSISFQGNGGSMNITFNGALKDDGTLAGTFDFGQGEMKWSATRAKN